MYADVMTDSMRHAIDETNRRRGIQEQYNKQHGITPKTIQKAVRDLISISKRVDGQVTDDIQKDMESMGYQELNKLMKEITKKMHAAAAELDFERAATLRDQMMELKTHLQELQDAGKDN